MKITSFTVLIIGCASLASAQPIHSGCGTKQTSYGSPAEWVTRSAQIHKGGPGTNSMADMLGHSHEDEAFPECGIFNGQFITIPYSQTLFMTQGHIDRIEGISGGDSQEGNVVSFTVSNDPFAFRQKWIGTVTATANHPAWPMPTNTIGYPLVGSDTGVVIIEGEVTLNLGDHFNGIKNGWTNTQLVTNTTYYSGDTSQVILRLAYYTTEDITAGMYYSTPHTSVVEHTVFTSSGNFGFGSFGILETSPLPINDPISSDNPYTVTASWYLYTATQFGFSRNLVDANLHAGDLGIIYAETPHGVTPATLSALTVTFPGSLTPGIHSDLEQGEAQGPASINGSPDFSNIQEWANLKYYFVVGTNTNPPPPVQTWQIINTFNQLSIQQLFDSVFGFLDQYRLCTTICSNSIQ